ncbi:MAG: Cu-processing system ATP-binding protein [Gammaproteobacteria bacterium]|jgi:Cu-processing system ATP-binding protein
MIKTNAIDMQQVSKNYDDKRVVNRVDLQVSRGECLLLVGHNGAGKTTLMKLMLGLTRPSGGDVSVLGDDPASIAAVARRGRLGFLPETVAFPPTMSGREVLKFYARLNNNTTAQCEQLLERVGLQPAANQRVSTYSKGMRQRLGLAQALLGEPELLLLDEPTTGLDPVLRQKFYDIIGEMQQCGTTAVISSHALNAFEARVDRVAIMREGALVAHDSLENLSKRIKLPVKMHIRVAAGQAGQLAKGLDSRASIGHINAQSFDLECLHCEKMAIVRQLSSLGEQVLDVDIAPPRLDDVYHYYMRQGDEQTDQETTR